MATNYGNVSVASYSQGYGTTVGWPLDALTADHTLTSVTIRNGSTLGTIRPRVAIYKNTSTSSPVGATLVRDFGQMTGGTINTDQTLTAGNEALSSGDVLWLVMKTTGTSAEIIVANSAGAGDFVAQQGASFLNGQIANDPTVAFPSSISGFNVLDMGNMTPTAYLTIEEASSAPTISAGTPTGTVSSSANLGFTTTLGSGDGRVLLDTTANFSGVTAAQIIAGLKANSSTAAYKTSLITIGSTSVSGAITGIAAGVYQAAAAQSASTGLSNVLTWSVGVPPTLTSATGTATGAVSATGGVTTDQSNGTLYAVVTSSATAPTAAQIKSGLNHLGAAATWGSSQAISTTGAKSFNASGLTTGVAQYFHFMHEDNGGYQSAVVSSSAFTPAAGVAVTSVSSDNVVQAGETSVIVTGTSLGDTTGTLSIASNGATQSQTPTAWGSATVTFDMVLGDLPYGTATFTLVTGA